MLSKPFGIVLPAIVEIADIPRSTLVENKRLSTAAWGQGVTL